MREFVTFNHGEGTDVINIPAKGEIPNAGPDYVISGEFSIAHSASLTTQTYELANSTNKTENVIYFQEANQNLVQFVPENSPIFISQNGPILLSNKETKRKKIEPLGK